jgi:hypothetical protein
MSRQCIAAGIAGQRTDGQFPGKRLQVIRLKPGLSGIQGLDVFKSVYTVSMEAFDGVAR